MNDANMSMTDSFGVNSKLQVESGQASLVRVCDLFSMQLEVPAFQRPYDWRSKQVAELLSDLDSSSENPLFVGLVVLLKGESGTYQIVDGQQRISTLFMLMSAGDSLPENVLRPRVRKADQTFFRSLVDNPSFVDTAEPETLSQHLLRSAFRQMAASADHIAERAKRATCIVYAAPDLWGATSLFERINLRGRDVSQFDLVKNRLIGWLGSLATKHSKDCLEVIETGYDRLYRKLNPSMRPGSIDPRELDVDRLLRVHWILFTRTTFKSADRVIDALEKEVRDHSQSDSGLAKFITEYVDSLELVAGHWAAINEPALIPHEASSEFSLAIEEFRRLNRYAELEPLIVAAMYRFGLGSDTADFVKYCSIASFRDTLAGLRSNRGRSRKWTMARDLYRKRLCDEKGDLIEAPARLTNMLFWRIPVWWNLDESEALGSEIQVTEAECAATALNTATFYQSFAQYAHYFFWEYGRMLSLGPKEKSRIYGAVPVEIDHFQSGEWATFREQWDIEHIFPKNPDLADASAKKLKGKLGKHRKEMSPRLNHLGNLTVVPRGANRGLLSNSDFETKRRAMLARSEVRFNQLLNDLKYIGNRTTKPFWGPNNVSNRYKHLLDFADVRWGTLAIKALGVRKVDGTVDFSEEIVLDTDADDVDLDR